jgi:hypothetical protein
MKRSTASRGAFAILVGLPLLAVGGVVVDGPPAVVFFIGVKIASDVPRWAFGSIGEPVAQGAKSRDCVAGPWDVEFLRASGTRHCCVTIGNRQRCPRLPPSVPGQ